MPDDILATAADRAERSPLEGAGMAKDAADLVTKVASGDWTEGLISLASLAYETKDFLADPLAKLTSMGLGWIIEFFGPLHWLLDQLTGDQEQLNLIVETWSGIAGEMSAAADDLHTRYTTDSANWTGPAVAQYRVFCADRVELYRAASATAQSVADNARMSGTVLTVVRELVRGLFTDAVGKAISIACRYPPPTTPAAAPEIATMITDTSSQAVQWVRKLERAFGNAGELLSQSGSQFRGIRSGLKLASQMPTLARRVGVASAVFEETAHLAKDVSKRVVKEIPGQLPEKVTVEVSKGVANTAAVMAGEPEPPADQSQLYDEPGPHRVTGNL